MKTYNASIYFGSQGIFAHIVLTKRLENENLNFTKCLFSNCNKINIASMTQAFAEKQLFFMKFFVRLQERRAKPPKKQSKDVKNSASHSLSS